MLTDCVNSGVVFHCFDYYCGIHVENIKILSWKRYTSAAQYTVYFQTVIFTCLVLTINCRRKKNGIQGK